MSDDKEPVRYHVVRYTLTLIHEFPAKYDHGDFYFTEHNCFGNVVNELHEAVSIDQDHNSCSICAARQAQYIGDYATVDEATEAGWRLTPKATPYEVSRERRRKLAEEP